MEFEPCGCTGEVDAEAVAAGTGQLRCNTAGGYNAPAYA